MNDTLNLYNSDEYLGKVLVQKGVISDAQYQETLILLTSSGSQSGGLGKLLVKQGYIASEEVLQTIQISATQAVPGPASGTLNMPGMSTPMPIEVAAAARNEKMVFGKYVLVSKLGEGGFALVYKSWDTFLRQFVAIKVLKKQEFGGGGPDDSASQQDIADFLKEARTSVKLRHPNFVHVYEVGSIEAKYYLSMELVDGPTFYELIHGTRERCTDTYFPTAPERFLTIMRDVALAVHYAHTQNPPLVHRDLKPQNILVDKEGKCYVADLGLAKEVRLERSETVTGVVKGTPWYMAPEQAAGNSKDIDARTDVWQLGAILYEVLTGRVPFVRDSVQALLNAICNDEPPRPNEAVARSLQEKSAGSHRPKPVPRALETICLKALEKKKFHRYESAKAFADDIDRYLHAQTIIAAEPSLIRRMARRVRMHPLVSGTLAALLLAAAVGAAVLYWKPPADPAVPIVERATGHLQRKHWPGLRTAVADLKAQAQGHEGLGRFQKALADHEAEHERLRRDWDQSLVRLRSDVEGLAALEAAYAGCEELQPQFGTEYKSALVDVQGAVRSRAREIAAYPPDRWVEEELKREARGLTGKVSRLLALKGHVALPFAAAPELAADREALDKAVAYLGRWSLRGNVLPFAEVVLFRGDVEWAKDLTPLLMKDLEVCAEKVRLEFYWPSRQDPKVKVTRDLPPLRHGVTVSFSGDAKKGEVTIRP